MPFSLYSNPAYPSAFINIPHNLHHSPAPTSFRTPPCMISIITSELAMADISMEDFAPPTPIPLKDREILNMAPKAPTAPRKWLQGTRRRARFGRSFSSYAAKFRDDQNTFVDNTPRLPSIYPDSYVGPVRRNRDRFQSWPD
jgi:hypothetical protein